MDIPLAGLSVHIGMPAGRLPEWATVTSLIETMRWCDRRNVPCTFSSCTSGIVTYARDQVLAEFLAGKHNRLFWIDSDIEWSLDQFMKMLALSTKVEVLAASYPAKVDGPPLYFIQKENGSTVEIGDLGLVEVDGVGLGFTIIQRHVIEELVATKPEMKDANNDRMIKSVFRTDIYNGCFRGEDIAFFHDIRALGYKVWVDPSVDLPHHGHKRYTGRLLDALTPKENGECLLKTS